MKKVDYWRKFIDEEGWLRKNVEVSQSVKANNHQRRLSEKIDWSKWIQMQIVQGVPKKNSAVAFLLISTLNLHI